MSAYESLASCYDSLTADIDHEAWTDYLARHFERAGVSPQSVLDLACGTGAISKLLAGRGYRVIGADMSPDMLSEAFNACQGLEPQPFFICQDMRSLELGEQVDAAVCCLDSVNYLSGGPDDALATFHRVCDSLTPGGVFVFDINTPEKLRGLDGQLFIDENDEVYCVWRAEYDEAERICAYGMDIFRRRGQLWERDFEEHLEFAFEPEELTALLEQAGFRVLGVYGELSFDAPKAGEQRVFISARKI